MEIHSDSRYLTMPTESEKGSSSQIHYRWSPSHGRVGGCLPAAGRVGDIAWVPADSHGHDCCAHSAQGPAVAGSPDTFINGMQALRVGDPGTHSSCCGSNSWRAAQGAPGVFINDIPVHRVGDSTTHCGGTGVLIVGSPNVIIGNMGGGAAVSYGSVAAAQQFEAGFELRLDGSGDLAVGVPYRLTLPDGRVQEGVTNERGRTAVVETDSPGTVVIEIFRYPVRGG